jgi:DnaJ-class molecular chaperone
MSLNDRNLWSGRLSHQAIEAQVRQDAAAAARPPYGDCPACEGSGGIVQVRGPQPWRTCCNVCDGTGYLDAFGCPARAPERKNSCPT